MIDRARAARVLSIFHDLKLATAKEVEGVLWIFADRFPFSALLRRAETIHVHGRVDDVAAMPHERIRAAGGRVENQREGYIKYAFDGGVNMILSSIDVAE